jgi:hypothetical protein
MIVICITAELRQGVRIASTTILILTDGKLKILLIVRILFKLYLIQHLVVVSKVWQRSATNGATLCIASRFEVISATALAHLTKQIRQLPHA